MRNKAIKEPTVLKGFYLAALYFFLSLPAFSQLVPGREEGLTIEISGQVIDQRKQPLPDVSVLVKGTVTGAITNLSGVFVLRARTKLPLILVFSSIGFQQR